MRIFAVLLLLLLARPTTAQTPAIPPVTPPGTTPVPNQLFAPNSTQMAPLTVPGLLPSQIFPPLVPAQPTAPASPPPATAPVAQPAAGTAPPYSYGTNLRSNVFGTNLFTGAFVASPSSLYNPDHVIAIGDQLQVRLWGAYQFDSLLTVDAQGNIFVPRVGPLKVVGVPNKDLQRQLDDSLRSTFRANVQSYISLMMAQPVRVFVTGYVFRPGMYQGTSTDSVLRYLDLAGGIDPDRGSFLEVQVLRGSQVRGNFNLYDFLLKGVSPGVQLGDGDVILVAARKNIFSVQGLAENTNLFEFTGSRIELNRLIALAKPFPTATHVRVIRNTGTILNVDYYALSEVKDVELSNGDVVSFTADKRPGTISVRVQGEHTGPQEFVVPWGSRIGDVLKQIQYTSRSDSKQLQLFRQSVKTRQKDQLEAALNTLQSSVLTARSGTNEEAALRRQEADLFLQWVERARKITPLGQVLIAQSTHLDDLLLEDADVINVPVKDGLVLVGGEVLFPNAIAYDVKLGISDYIKRAGGYTQSANTSRIVIAHRDGSFDEDSADNVVRAGDQILVLPKVETKSRQILKEVVGIMFQIAVIAGIVFGL